MVNCRLGCIRFHQGPDIDVQVLENDAMQEFHVRFIFGDILSVAYNFTSDHVIVYFLENWVLHKSGTFQNDVLP